MTLNESRASRPAIGQFVRLSTDHKVMLDNLKSQYRISHSDVIRRGIELVTKQFAPYRKDADAGLQA